MVYALWFAVVRRLRIIFRASQVLRCLGNDGTDALDEDHAIDKAKIASFNRIMRQGESQVMRCQFLTIY